MATILEEKEMRRQGTERIRMLRAEEKRKITEKIRKKFEEEKRLKQIWKQKFKEMEKEAKQLVKKEKEEKKAGQEDPETRMKRRKKEREYALKWRTKRLKRPLERLRSKVKSFQKKSTCSCPFTAEDVVAKFGPNPKCYLTGLPIDYEDSSTYQLDHFVSLALGGGSSLENLRLCHPIANQMKNGHTMEKLLKFCRLITQFCPEDLSIYPSI